MSTSRVVEMVTESLPGTVIQVMAMLAANGDRSFTPVLATSSSILTSAFISTQVSQEGDNSEEFRIKEPAFYGYLPTSLTRRAFTLLQIFLMATFTLILRALSFVMLA